MSCFQFDDRRRRGWYCSAWRQPVGKRLTDARITFYRRRGWYAKGVRREDGARAIRDGAFVREEGRLVYTA